ncbi:MAG: carbonic anhydrase [Paracoccaceae bacterium]
MKSYDTVLRSMAAFVWLGAAGALAADGHNAPHAAKAHDAKAPAADSHKASKKPMALTPAHKAKAPMHKPKAKAHGAKPSAHGAKPSMHKTTAAKKVMPTKKMSVHKPAMAKPAKKVAMAPHTPKKSHAAHWGYRGAGGPEHWGDLKPTFKACSAGRHQSPINLEATEAAHVVPLTMHYKVSLIDLVNNGHTVQANYGKGSYITLGNERFDLLQFHFHTPSEHRVAGRSFPMEIHFVHRNKRGQLAVVGVLVATGDYNLAAREIWDRLPAQAHTKSANTRALINARDLLPGDTSHFRYSGSLTTPPCSENVKWLVLQTPVRFSEGQIGKLHQIIGMNARPAQARNSRYLLQSIGG